MDLNTVVPQNMIFTTIASNQGRGNYVLFQNDEFNWTTTKTIFKKIGGFLWNMFYLQFLNDIICNLCLIIDTSRLEMYYAKEFQK